MDGRALVALGFSALLLACGGSSTPANPPTAATGGSTPSMTAGTTGTNSGAQSGAGTGAGGSAAPAGMTITCGTMMCAPPAAVPGLNTPPPPACCVPGTMACGTKNNSGMCVAPPPDAPKCPAFGGFGSMARNCCTPMNTCGIDATALGMGCLDVSAMTGGKGYNCDGTPIGGGSAGAGGGAAGSAMGAAGSAAGSGGSAVSAGTSGAAGSGSAGRAGGSAGAAGR